MIIKWIRCEVREEKKHLFTLAQSKWKGIRNVPGFIGQAGGWSSENPGTALVAAFWSSESAYKNFMQSYHDDIYDGTAQKGTYESLKVDLYCSDVQIDIRGLLSDAEFLHYSEKASSQRPNEDRDIAGFTEEKSLILRFGSANEECDGNPSGNGWVLLEKTWTVLGRQ